MRITNVLQFECDVLQMSNVSQVLILGVWGTNNLVLEGSIRRAQI
jgi:hypothetical protein